MRPAAQAAAATVASRNTRYRVGDALSPMTVEAVRRLKVKTLITSARLIRKGYDAEYCILVRTSIAPRLVTVETVKIAD
jgi:hypothetical protein